MRSVNEHGRPTDDNSFRELRLLEEVDTRAEVSQRHLAHQLGVALGVANLLIRRLATKGYIRVTQVGWKRWVYVLTPAGVARKVQLTLAYVDRVLDHYQRVRSSLREGLASEILNTESRVAIYGSSELAELVYLALRDLGVTEIEVYALMGGANIIVPPDINVRTSGTGVLGGFGSVESRATDEGAPTLHIKGFAVMGGVEIKVKKLPLLKRLQSD